MLDSNTFIIIQVVLFLAAMVQTTFGFGSAIVAMAILVLLIGSNRAAPLVALVGIFLSGSIMLASWRSIDWKATWRILLASTLAAPLGILLLTRAPESLIKAILGWTLIVYGIYCLLPWQLFKLKNDNWAFPFGFLGGILGSAYNINGPPVLIYGTLRRWPPEAFRASLNGYFFPSGIIVVLGHGAAGLWTREMWIHFGVSIPFLLLALWLGSLINHHMNPKLFTRVLYMLIIGMGLMLLV